MNAEMIIQKKEERLKEIERLLHVRLARKMISSNDSLRKVAHLVPFFNYEGKLKLLSLYLYHYDQLARFNDKVAAELASYCWKKAKELYGSLSEREKIEFFMPMVSPFEELQPLSWQIFRYKELIWKRKKREQKRELYKHLKNLPSFDLNDLTEVKPERLRFLKAGDYFIEKDKRLAIYGPHSNIKAQKQIDDEAEKVESLLEMFKEARPAKLVFYQGYVYALIRKSVVMYSPALLAAGLKRLNSLDGLKPYVCSKGVLILARQKTGVLWLAPILDN